MKALKTIYFLHLLPALVIHELSHFLAIILTGRRFLGLRVNFNFKARQASVNIAHGSRKRNKWIETIISIAPLLTWLVLIVTTAFWQSIYSFALFIYLYTAYEIFMPSDQDNQNIIEAWTS